jgi:hypothetical protein
MARQKKRSTDTAAHLKPIAKNIIKQALRVYDAAKEAFTEAGEQFEDLVHEARAEMKDGKPPKPAKREKRRGGR